MASLILQLPHGSIQAAVRAHLHRGSGVHDALALLQIGVAITLADACFLGGDEGSSVNMDSAGALSTLFAWEIPEFIEILAASPKGQVKVLCDRTAADALAALPKAMIDTRPLPLAMRPERMHPLCPNEQALYDWLTKALDGSESPHYRWAGTPSSREHIASYLFANNSELCTAALGLAKVFSDTGQWNENVFSQLLCVIHVAYNSAAAIASERCYHPGTAQLDLLPMRQHSLVEFIDRLNLDLPRNFGGPLSLLPTAVIAHALIQAADSRPEQIIPAALDFRSRAADLREWIAEHEPERLGAQRAHALYTKLEQALRYLQQGHTQGFRPWPRLRRLEKAAQALLMITSFDYLRARGAVIRFYDLAIPSL